MSWTDEMVSLLKDLWPTGKDTREIANLIGGGKSRQAVIGKAYRLKLGEHPNAGEYPGRPACGIGRPRKARPKVERKAAPRSNWVFSMKPNRKRTPPVEATEIAPEPKGRVTLLDLGPYRGDNSTCRWPTWDDATPADDKRYCGRGTRVGAVYCSFHGGKGYQASSSLKAKGL